MKHVFSFLLLLWTACGSEQPPKSERFDRIVSIVPGVTELLFEVGAQDQVVGVTTYCLYPPEAQEKETVGSLVLNFEKIVALKPDVVMSSRSLAEKSNLALEEMGMHVVRIDPESFEEIAEELRRLGRLTGHTEEGGNAAEEMMRRVHAVKKQVQGKPQPTVYLETSQEPLGTVGPNGYAGDVIRLAGGRNIMHDLGRPWAPASWEVVVKRNPDVILIAHDGMEELKSRPGWNTLKSRVHAVPKEAFIYPTPRLVRGLELAAKYFHEENQ